MSGRFVSLQNPQYRKLWWAGTFSFMSVQMQFLLRGVLAWDLTRRESALGLTYLLFGFSMLIATPLGGIATDRYPKRTVLLISQAAIALAAAGLGAAVLFDAEQFWMLLVVSTIHGGAFGFYGPARVAYSTDLVGRDLLGNAITLSLLSMNATRIFAPALAGVLIGVRAVGVGGVYLIAAVLSVVSFLLLLRLPSVRPVEAPGANPWVEIANGVRYVNERPELQRLMVSSFFVIMFAFNYVAFLPALVEDVFGKSDVHLGIISSASALGAVTASLFVASRADSAKASDLLIGAGLLFTLGVAALGAAPNFWAAFAVIFVIGAGSTSYQSLSSTLALRMTDDGYQGRVQSLMQLSFAGFGIAALPLGVLAETIGLRRTIMVMGGVGLVSIAVGALPRIGSVWRPKTAPQHCR
ncbi:MAG: MFS transporter [Actinomycetota bacterium]|nr:MFS transporter [Actinomycetota bacterium]